MKIRNGFVSNSSSSSFLIYGTTFDSNKTVDFDQVNQEYIEKLNNRTKDYNEKYGYNGKLLDKDEKIEFCQILDDDDDITLLDIHNPYGETLYVGLSWDNVKDNETGLEFKNRVESLFHEIFTDEYCKKLIFHTYSEAWHD